jgi:hypothetical protein
MEDSNKKLIRRCPRLGNPVPFQYCRVCDNDNQRPCFKILDCWWEYFDVVQYLKERLPEDQFNSLMDARPKPKVASLVELIEQARQRNK